MDEPSFICNSRNSLLFASYLQQVIYYLLAIAACAAANLAIGTRNGEQDT